MHDRGRHQQRHSSLSRLATSGSGRKQKKQRRQQRSRVQTLEEQPKARRGVVAKGTLREAPLAGHCYGRQGSRPDGRCSGLMAQHERGVAWRRRYEKERGRRGSRLGRWVPDPSLVTVEPGLPATFYLPRPCVADVLRLQGILCLRTRGAVGLRARVPAEVSGRDAAGGSAWSTAPTGPPGPPCGQREPAQDVATNLVEPGLPATFYLPRPCVADVLRLQGILCLRTRGAVGLRARVPAEVSGRDAAGGSAWSTAPTGPPGPPCEQRGAVGLRARVPAEVSGLYVVGGGAYTLQVAASPTVRATRSCRATGMSSSRCVQPRRGCGGGAYPSTSRLVDRADNASQLKT
ncbi:hypothetical protein MRX96_043224 [Rhipicephalus microplus]